MQENPTHILQTTADGSHTLFVPSLDEHYHSVNGAIQESRHIFIEAGLHYIRKEHLRVLEIGFGTGLNAFMTLLEGEAGGRNITYFSIEKYPIAEELVKELNYAGQLCAEKASLFHALHTAEWNREVEISPGFSLHKIRGDSNVVELPERIDLVFFDAFAPEKQPEMWNPEIFGKIFRCINPGGVITTYCAKGVIRRMMQATGFTMERLPGPPGKREMLRGKRV